MTRLRTYRPALLVVLLLALFALPQMASAHEKRTVGNYTFVVGFLNEPAYNDTVNGLDLTLTDKDNKPVEGLDKTLKAEVISGGLTPMPLTIQSRFNMPGKYAAYFRPTKTGAYRFHITGAINGQNVDETFESGPGRFDDVESINALDYPAKAMSAADVSANVQAAQEAANSARSLGLAGLVVGALGVALAVVSLISRRRAVAPMQKSIA